MELLSTVVQLRARQGVKQYGFAGRQVQAWFLREVRRHEPELADQLHNENNAALDEGQIFRPYTVSTLYKGPNSPPELAEGDWCWVRITSLVKDLSEFLSGKMLPELLPMARVGQVEFDVQRWDPGISTDPRCGSESYAALANQAMRSYANALSFDFSSPTSFKEKGINTRIEKDVPLPIPDMVFGNYLKHWSAFSGEALSDEIVEFIKECLVVNELKIKSERVQFSFTEPNRATTGFVGQVRFRILGSKEKSRFGANWEHYSNIIRMLALYSFYCGTGHHTTLGLGQTRFTPSLNR